ncbi:pyridoxamine-phosphate oxidase [Marasmius tenuissimus]|uniref:pyridoxal 5'-phosphate synthase n=1 Tax=Marasmius tenuissimus TaxID=585030 RepID=A0ABR3A8E1_9AGAR
MSDVIISEPTTDRIKVLPHNQYQSPDHLSPSTALPSPLDQFHTWFKEAVEKGVKEPEAMSLSTATPDGVPSARFVLFKQLDSRGFVFFTNYTSRKSQELVSNPNAALAFYWREIHRSVRVVGSVEKISREESEEYFKSRPIGSQLGAWASKQSSVVGEGEVHERLKKIEERFGVHENDKETSVPLPEFWGGWRVVPKLAYLPVSFSYTRAYKFLNPPPQGDRILEWKTLPSA